MLIYANWRENDGVDLILFRVKRSASDSYTIRKYNDQKKPPKTQAKLVKCAKKQICGP